MPLGSTYTGSGVFPSCSGAGVCNSSPDCAGGGRDTVLLVFALLFALALAFALLLFVAVEPPPAEPCA